MATHDLNGRPVDLVVGIPSYNEADNIGFELIAFDSLA